MIARNHRNRINLAIRRRWYQLPEISLVSPWLRLSATLAGTALVVSGLAYGFRAGQRAASSFCQVPRVEPASGAATIPAAKTDPQSTPIQKDLEHRVKGLPGVVQIERENNSNVLQVVLRSDLFFRTGTASLDTDAELGARKIASLLRGFLSRTAIEIQGHTDDSPVVRQRNLYRSNWELSVARAASFLHVFEEAGFLKDKLKVVGFGDSRPLVPNRTRSGKKIEENLSRNRRIVLRVIPDGKAEPR